MSERADVIPSPTSRAYIPGLDGIRALAVMTIFLFHSQIVPHVPGELATTVFFFLSGFLITTLFIREWRKTGTISLGGFYYRRALRTLPPLFLVLGIALAIHFWLQVGDPLVPWKVAGHFFSFTNYALAFDSNRIGYLPGMALLWSLAVDEHYYLLFAPLFNAAMKRISMRAIINSILFLCASALLWRIWLAHANGGVSARETMSSDTRMDSILWGSLLALWRNPALDPDRAKALVKPVWLIAGILGLAFVEFSRNWMIIGTIGYTIQGISLIPIFALAMLYGGKGWLRFLQWPWLMWVSRASYPLYLLQWLMITTCSQYIPGPSLFRILVAALLTLGLGAAIHIYLEQPMAALRKKGRQVKAVTRPSLDSAAAIAG